MQYKEEILLIGRPVLDKDKSNVLKFTIPIHINYYIPPDSHMMAQYIKCLCQSQDHAPTNNNNKIIIIIRFKLNFLIPHEEDIKVQIRASK